MLARSVASELRLGSRLQVLWVFEMVLGIYADAPAFAEPPIGPRPQQFTPPLQPPFRDSAFGPPVSTNINKLQMKVEPTPSPAPPGFSSTQDFPPLAAPSAPPPSQPPIQRKTATGKNIKPVIPVVPPSNTRATVGTKESQTTGQHRLSTSAAAVEPPNATAVTALQTAQNPADTGDQITHSNTTIKARNKKQRPSKLDITAATDVLQIQSTPNASSDVRKTPGETPDTQPPTPATAVSQTSGSARPRQAQTIRVSKEDMQPPSPSTAPPATGSRQVSRRASLTSINRPDTPASEKVSDNASFTSMSRANSPPPSSRVGSAPVRQVTKSQQKKERQARAKLTEPKVEDIPAKVEEVQAPIVGRKKKTRKGRTTTGTADSTPTVTRPTSPSLKEDPVEEKLNPVATPATPVTPVKENKKIAQKTGSEIREPEAPSSPATPAGADQQKATNSAAAIFASLQSVGEISASAAELFKPVPGINHRFEPIEPNFDAADSAISDDQERILKKGEPVHIHGGPNNQVVILPDRRAINGFTAEQAARYVELRKKDLRNGDNQRAHQTLDGLVPTPRTVETALDILAPQTAGRDKKLSNPFITPAMGREPVASDIERLVNGVIGAARGGIAVENPTLVDPGDAEQALLSSRRETELLEKKLNGLMKKNRRMLFGNAH